MQVQAAPEEEFEEDDGDEERMSLRFSQQISGNPNPWRTARRTDKRRIAVHMGGVLRCLLARKAQRYKMGGPIAVQLGGQLQSFLDKMYRVESS